MISLKLILILLASMYTLAYPIAKDNCQSNCGGVAIPYPFGIGHNCSRDESFEVTCQKSEQGVEKPYILDNYEVLNIFSNQHWAEGLYVRINVDVARQCTNGDNVGMTINLTGTAFSFSRQNSVFSTGCGRLPLANTDKSQVGCFPSCSLTTQHALNDTCNGYACCKTNIPSDATFVKIYFANISWDNSQDRVLSNCSYTAIVEEASFHFNESYLTTGLQGMKMPLVLDWGFEGNVSSDTVQCYNEDYGGYLLDSNSSLYTCNCNDGFEGNPYLLGQCYDINECHDDGKNQCPHKRKCHNTYGSYYCSCPFGMRPGVDQFYYDHQSCHLTTASLIGLCLGLGIGILVLLSIGFRVYVVHKRKKKKKIKDDFFNRHGGWILYEEIIKSNKSFAFTVFTKEEVEQATNEFDSTKIIGEGGQGTVYKGTLKDHEVAIKMCKILDEKQKKEFGKEMVILSQINHKNIVKLLGCCLEVQVPMLVYEFIPNGTLFQNLHGKNYGINLSFEIRLRIAHESALALAYLHSSTSTPIHHGDVKSSNILLDGNYTAKVSDFGASILAPNDESQFVTLVQGTCGYLDPEYLTTCQLSDKSDVYSFGVVILELLTGKLPIYFDKPEDEKVLSSYFLTAMKENKLLDLLDDQIKRNEKLDLIMQVAELAKECLNLKGEERPTMKEVAERLEKIRKLGQEHWGQADHTPEFESLLGGPSCYVDPGSTRYFSIENAAEV